MARTEVKGVFTFECARHGVALVEESGMVPLAGQYDDDAVEPNGKYQVDLDDMDCPVYAAEYEFAMRTKATPEEVDALTCVDDWKVWLEQDA